MGWTFELTLEASTVYSFRHLFLFQTEAGTRNWEEKVKLLTIKP